MDAGHSSSSQVASVERRVAAIEAVFEQQGMEPKPFIETMTHPAEEEWVPRNGARVVAKAWTDPALPTSANGKMRLLNVSLCRRTTVIWSRENTPTIHNVIVCTLCSCTAFTIIGLLPDWYKDSTTALRGSNPYSVAEMGLDLLPENRD